MRVKSASMAFAVMLAGYVLPATVPTEAHAARAAQATPKIDRGSAHAQAASKKAPTKAKVSASSNNRRRATTVAAAQPRGLSCVPYARMITGMDISGNAYTWWGNAAGTYARGQAPEPGSVLAFRASGGMRSGHVAVVSRVVSRREILVDHSNWEGPGIRKGTVMRGVSVIDASPNNDWSDVRVQVGHSAGTYGRNYPTYGFIYNRQPGRMLASTTTTAAPLEELAEAPSPHAVDHMNMSMQALGLSPR